MVEMMNTLCNIWLVNIIECVIFIWLYIYFCMYMLLILAMRLPNPGYLQDVAGNYDAHEGHQIWDAPY
jgi:amino acid permease